ncbi:MAG: hypothetical protein NVSMB14_13310 [Isosphaeraceae bacterium]
MYRRIFGIGILSGVLGVSASGLLSASPVEKPALERVATIELKGPVGGMDHLAIDAKRGRLLVANTVNGTLDVVDLKAGKLLKQVPDQGGIHGIAYSPETDRIFVGNGAEGACNALSGDDFQVVKHIALGEESDNVRYAPRTRRLYVTHADKEITILDAETLKIRGAIAFPKDLGAILLEKSRPRLYVNAKGTGEVWVIDTEKDAVIARHPVAPAGLNSAFAIDEPNRRLFVGCRKPASLVVMNCDTGQIVARAAIVGDVDDLTFDSARKRIYASCGEGGISVVHQVDPDHYESLATIPTVKGARTSVFEPDSGLLYLAVPRRADRSAQKNPEVWVFRTTP